MRLPNNREGAFPIRTVSEDREVGVQRGRSLNAESTHNGETGAITEGKIVSAPLYTDLPGVFQIGHTHWFKSRYAGSQAFPEAFGSHHPKPIAEQ